MQKLLLCLLAITIYSYANATQTDNYEQKSCSNVDLRSLNKLTKINRDQGNIDWCYAFAAADLVQFFYNTPPLSASNIAINYNDLLIAKIIHGINKIKFQIISGNRNVKYLEPETGFIEKALKNSFKHGFCLREKMPDEKIRKLDFTNNQVIDVDYEDAMYDILKNLKKMASSNLSNSSYSYELPQIPYQEVDKIIANTKPQKIFNKFNEISCRDSIINLPKSKIIQKIRYPRIFNEIDVQLNHNNIVAIDYTAKVLVDKNQAHQILKRLHSSTIVGRRWNGTKNSCEYLVRNSGGSSCAHYDPSYDCDQGNIWIPEKYLKKSILRVTYLK